MKLFTCTRVAVVAYGCGAWAIGMHARRSGDSGGGGGVLLLLVVVVVEVVVVVMVLVVVVDARSDM